MSADCVNNVDNHVNDVVIAGLCLDTGFAVNRVDIRGACFEPPVLGEQRDSAEGEEVASYWRRLAPPVRMEVPAMDKNNHPGGDIMNAINRCIGTMDFLMPFCAAETERALGSSELFEAAKENLRRRYALTASQMHCPLHQRSARIELDGDRLDDSEIEVFTCCDKFAQRVRDTIQNGSSTAQRRAA